MFAALINHPRMDFILMRRHRRLVWPRVTLRLILRSGSYCFTRPGPGAILRSTSTTQWHLLSYWRMPYGKSGLCREGVFKNILFKLEIPCTGSKLYLCPYIHVHTIRSRHAAIRNSSAAQFQNTVPKGQQYIFFFDRIMFTRLH